MHDVPFGRCAAAMITPFTDDGALDPGGAQRLATHLVDRGGCDTLVLSGTTGESGTTSDAEKATLVRAVVEAVGDRAAIVAGVGSADTRHSVELARQARSAGAHGVLVVTPYYSRPTQEGIVAHLGTVADATDLPVMLYDIPARTGEGTALTADSLRRLAEHPRIVAVKDCAGDLMKTGLVLADTDLAYYAGSEELNLPLLAIGARGVVSTVANVAGAQVRAVVDAFTAGDAAEAGRRHRALLPLADAVFGEVPGAVAVKALFRAAGMPGGPVRAPLLPAGRETTERLVAALRTALGGQ
ncbi:4-hydroxy-tetrahydrodipicolinate synthase [Streptomyces sp. RFCAC02]|uniref:4-hydroxy-tetrahydrodipicolinate synthase n=1 Tax=Streptomyces sp. RFCAC02 TaxID=2499143 RepID=UPI0010213DF4|nr:4-hydroxy-tetrahydrodipicolinate synthase [Streptomyces sp. RFCAC02]